MTDIHDQTLLDYVRSYGGTVTRDGRYLVPFFYAELPAPLELRFGAHHHHNVPFEAELRTRVQEKLDTLPLYERLCLDIFRWGYLRRIIQNSTPAMQARKGLSEYGELHDALLKNDKALIADAIGDVAVTVLMAIGCAKQTPYVPKYRPAHPCDDDLIPMFSIHARLERIIRATPGNGGWDTELIAGLFGRLSALATTHGLEFVDCLAVAWDQIKDRRGYLNQQGVFVKEEAPA